VHYLTTPDKMDKAIEEILREAEERAAWFTAQGKLIEAQRITERTMYDVEFLKQVGYCKGVENYSRILEGRAPGSTPHTLLDYFPKDYLMFVDESHVTLPQVRGMGGGDRSRKTSLVDYGFRLPSAFDNRPLNFQEYDDRVNQVVYVSATPGEFEKTNSARIVEQIIRPTGLLDPEISVRPTEGQIDDLLSEINARVEKKERVLVVTVTKKLAESLAQYLEKMEIRVRYLHHDIETLDRIQILRDLRNGDFDVLVGINLLREGLDLPEVSLVAILDADKQGFLRNETSLIQIIGRAARNAEGNVIMYGDSVTPAMEAAIRETERRRGIQMEYNREHGIVPKTIVKKVDNSMTFSTVSKDKDSSDWGKIDPRKLSKDERQRLIDSMTEEMKQAAKLLDFEQAAKLRDEIRRIKGAK
ncbi:MAG: UvrB/UvrC motif-containing protein, partial [Clostridia bacterium]|nr:UvrB/UvrC motif-containing protein [Clostridia bacterium]